MSYIYEPEIEEEDEGYSIPKILVAVLLLTLIGVGGYIIYQGKQIKSLNETFMSQQDSLKVFEKELETMILKYNLAIDDNGSLSEELKGERDRIIRFRDSVKKLKTNDKISIEEYNKAIRNIRESSTISFDEPIKTNPTVVQNSEKQEVNSELPKSTVENQSDSKVVLNLPTESQKTSQTEQVNSTSNNVVAVQTFERVEVPPTFPGCIGDLIQRKNCFNQKVKTTISNKFDPSIASDLNLKSGVQKIMVSFTVDKFGNVTNILAKGTHPKIEAEAIKAAKSLPKMSAARQNGVPVDVVYNVPISFVIE